VKAVIALPDEAGNRHGEVFFSMVTSINCKYNN